MRVLSGMGFDFIRLTLDPGIFIDVAGTERAAILDAQAVALILRIQAAGFSVVVDLHPVSLNPAYAPRALVASRASAFSAYCDLVERFAAALNRLPPDKTVFELMNEPWIEATAEWPRWQQMLEILHQRARKAAPDLALVLTGASWSNWPALLQLYTKPFRGSNVFYTFHYYEPHGFTHQGVSGDYTQFISEVPWPMTAVAVPGLIEAADRRVRSAPNLPADTRANARFRTRQLLENLLLKKHDAAQIEKDFAAVAQWCKVNDIPPERVLLGEFGCVASAVGVPLGGDRLRWIETVRRAAEKERFPWAYWTYKGWGGMGMIDPEGRFDGTVLAPLGLNDFRR